MCQTQQTFIMFIIVLGQHVSILIESSSGPSKKIDPYIKCLKCAVGSIKIDVCATFLYIGSSILIEIDGFSLTSYKFNVCHPEVFNTYINIQ